MPEVEITVLTATEKAADGSTELAISLKVSFLNAYS